MSLTAALLAYGFWQILAQTGRIRGLTILETNISQTAAAGEVNVTPVSAMGKVTPSLSSPFSRLPSRLPT
jgi:hypothetical protein